MEVTILTAPAGCGLRPVKYAPKVHTISVDGNAPDAADAVERYTKKLVSAYHSQVYTWESATPSSCLLEKFERYVAQMEEARISGLKEDAVMQAYRAACMLGDAMFIETPTIFRQFVGSLSVVSKEITVEVCREILHETFIAGEMAPYDDFRRTVKTVLGVKL